jgi:hypothetical protein
MDKVPSNAPYGRSEDKPYNSNPDTQKLIKINMARSNHNLQDGIISAFV